jgi:hypothetical protein
VFTKAREAAPVLAVASKLRRQGKGAKSRWQVRIAGNVATTKARRIRSAAQGRKLSIDSRRVTGRGRTAMNDLRIERRAERL